MDYYTSNKLISLFIGVIAGIMVLTGLMIPALHEHQIARDKFEAAIENDYTAYLDGDEVDISKIDTYNYVVTVDSESKSIYLTKKGILDWGQVIRVK